MAISVPIFFAAGCSTVPEIDQAAASAAKNLLSTDAVSSLLNGPQPISTSFADTKEDDSLSNTFGDDKTPTPLDKQPRSSGGGYLLAPGFYEMTCKSYCLHAGTSGPSEGDGYLYAPLKGARLDVIQAIIRNSSGKPNLPQTTIQLLIWAVLAKTNFENLPTDLKSAAVQLLTPQQLFELNGGALGLIPGDVLAKAVASLPESVQEILTTENKLRQLFAQASVSYQAAESLAVLPNSAANSKNYPSGVWSKHPNGYDVRYFPSSYTRIRVQVYVPDQGSSATTETVGLHFASFQTSTPLVTYDATADAGVPADNSKQRLAPSNDDAGTDAGNETSTNNPNHTSTPYDPCTVIDANNPALTAPLSAGQPSSYQAITDTENSIATANGWKPDATGFETADEAGKAAISYIDPTSIQHNREYAGNIYLNPKTGLYYFSEPVEGTMNSSLPGLSPVPAGDTIVATYHTHAGNFAVSDEYVSPGDIAKAAGSGKPSYVGTPEGKVLKYDPNRPSPSPCADLQGLAPYPAPGSIEVLVL